MVTISSGLWWDHSKSAALAATITLSTNSSNFLLSALALLVTIAGASAWNITAFILHAVKSRRGDGPVHAVDLMHQVSLRNSGSAINTLWESIKVHRAWSKTKPRHLARKTASVAFPALVVWAGFAVAAIFTSNVANKSYGSTIARLEEQNCGFWEFNQTTLGGLLASQDKATNDTTQARNYVSNFYVNTAKSSVAQSPFVQLSLPTIVNNKAPCPLPASRLCLLGRNAAYSMSTPPLDSHEMLGINASPKDRVTIQINATCSPIGTGEYVVNSVINNATAVSFFLGPILNNTVNTTYQYSYHVKVADVGYKLDSIFAYARNSLSNVPWTPIPDFNRTDADVSVYFLSQNGIHYFSPVADPWFSANVPVKSNFLNGSPVYGADYDVNVMACAEQYVICNPSTLSCMPPGGWIEAQDVLSTNNPLGLNSAQLLTSSRILWALGNINLNNVVQNINIAALWANGRTRGNLSPALPSNQWQMETLGWFQTVLAELQASIVNYASSDDGLNPYTTPTSAFGKRSTLYSNDVAAQQCKNQLVRTTGEVQNFSFLGVMIIVFFSGFLIALDLLMEPVVNLFNRRREWRSMAMRARQADNKLHLLRMALRIPSQAGKDDWAPGASDIPIIDGAEQFRRPMVSDNLTWYPTSHSIQNIQNDQKRPAEFAP